MNHYNDDEYCDDSHDNIRDQRYGQQQAQGTLKPWQQYQPWQWNGRR